jgi:hypothetical protein
MGGLSASLKAFEFRLCKIEGIADRPALLRAYRDHFANRALRHHLRAHIRRRRIAGQQGRHVTARRIIVQRADGRLFLRPGLEIAQLLVTQVAKLKSKGAIAAGRNPKNSLIA